MSSVTLATIADRNNTVTSYPEGVPKDFSEALLRFISRRGSKAAPFELLREQHTPVTAFYCMADEHRNMVGIAVHGEDEKDTASDEDKALLRDLAMLAEVSAAISSSGSKSSLQGMRSFCNKLLGTRVDAEGAGESSRAGVIAKANDEIEVLRRLVEKKRADAAALPHHHHHPHSSITVAGATAAYKKYPGDAHVRAEAEAEQQKKDAELAEQNKDKMKKKKPEHLGSLSAETVAEWEKFQKTKMYKASMAVIALCALISVVFFICNPSLTACDFSDSSPTASASSKRRVMMMRAEASK